uniref:Uncharacterized protein n=1 Tax=Knipowitschia caucasica TaxID=637954 RepID=A0AAV2M8B8_KNICA
MPCPFSSLGIPDTVFAEVSLPYFAYPARVLSRGASLQGCWEAGGGVLCGGCMVVEGEEQVDAGQDPRSELCLNRFMYRCSHPLTSSLKASTK